MNQHFNQLYNLTVELDEQPSCLAKLKEILERENLIYTEEHNALYVHIGDARILVYQEVVLLHELWKEIDGIVLTKTDAVC